MESITWLVVAGIVVWVGIGLCLFQLGRRQRVLSKQLKHLEQISEEL